MDEFWTRAAKRLEAEERTQAWLARRVGVSKQLVNMWVLGRIPTPAHRLEQVAAILDVTVEEPEATAA